MLWSRNIITVAWMQISGYDVIKKMRFLEHFLLETELVINK